MAHPPDSSRIAVIIPVFNRPRAVLAALDSVRAQTLPPHRVIVVDDGSTDDTPHAVRRWLAQHGHPHWRLITQRNAGPSRARNRGAAEATDCDVLAFLDSDDIWPADFLQRLLPAMHDENVIAASCDRLCIGPDGQERLSAAPLDGRATHSIIFQYCPNPSSTLLRRSAFEAINGFDHRYCSMEDQDLFLRISRLGEWRYVPGVAITYIQTGLPADEAGHLSALSVEWKHRLRRLKVFERFFDAWRDDAALAAARPRKMAMLWHDMGKAFQRAARPRLAAAAYRRAVRENPLHHRSWSRIVRTTLALMRSSRR